MALVQLSYKQVIDETSVGDFERKVFYATYEEFIMKSQAYNPGNKIKTFTELKAHDGRANSLHYKISFATGHFIDALNHKTHAFADNIGNPLEFDVARFELLESDIFDMSAHKLSIQYITEPLTLCSVIGEYLLLAKGQVDAHAPAESFLLKMQPNISIINYQLSNEQIENTLIPLHY